MIYRRLMACMLAACLAVGMIAPDALAWQTDASQTASEVQAKPETAEEEKAEIPDPTPLPEEKQEAAETATPAPEKTEEKTAASGDEKAEASASESEKEAEVSETPVPEKEPESGNTADPDQDDASENAESGGTDAGSAEDSSVGEAAPPSAEPEANATPEPTKAPEDGETTPGPTPVPEGDGETAETTQSPDNVSQTPAPEEEPAEKATAQPMVDETAKPESAQEPEKTDAPDSTEAPEEVSELRLKAKADRLHAFVDRDTVKVQASISGGTAPYEVSFRAKGAASEKKSVALESEDTCTFKCEPDTFGSIEITVKVTDAAGDTATGKIEVAAPVRITEDPEDWEKDFADVELTGDWRVDLIAIALTQLGYEESSRNFVIEEDGKRKGYTRYGDWYSYSSDYYDWCAMFICFCMHYAGISRTDYPWDNISHNWKKNLENRGAFEASGEYEPRSGDLIFFNKDEDPRMDHIGIVEFVDGEYVHTIEGNAGKAVKRRSYSLDDETIAGYGNTEYLMEKAGVETEAVKDKIKQQVRERYDGYTAGTMVNIRAEASAESAWIACIPEKDTRVEVLGVAFSGEQMWYQICYEDYEGYILGSLLKVEGYAALAYAATHEKSE